MLNSIILQNNGFSLKLWKVCFSINITKWTKCILKSTLSKKIAYFIFVLELNKIKDHAHFFFLPFSYSVVCCFEAKQFSRFRIGSVIGYIISLRIIFCLQGKLIYWKPTSPFPLVPYYFNLLISCVCKYKCFQFLCINLIYLWHLNNNM